MAEQKKDEIVERVVKGNKPFLYRDPETGERSRVAPKRKVRVRASTARQFKDVLEDPDVMRAKMAALQKEQEQQESEEKTKQAQQQGKTSEGSKS